MMPQTQYNWSEANRMEDLRKLLCNEMTLVLNLRSMRRDVYAFRGGLLVRRPLLVRYLHKPSRKYYRSAS